MKLSTSTEWLLFHLWKSNPDTGQSCPGVIIPDTIIYRFWVNFRWAQPYFWYYTSNDGKIVRKTKDRISIDNISSTFNQNLVAETQLPGMPKFVQPKINDEEIVAATYMTSYPIKEKNKIMEKIDFEHF